MAAAFFAAPIAAQASAVEYVTVSKGGEGVDLLDFEPVISTITFSGVTGNVTDLTVTLDGLSHSYAGDVFFALVHRETGTNITFMSDAGGASAMQGWTLGFSDHADGALFVPGGINPDGLFEPGTYKPLNGYSEVLDPVTNVSSFSGFAGLAVNGDWQLYATDNGFGETGWLGGWTLTITTDVAIKDGGEDGEDGGSGGVGAVPEPASWAMMIAGFGLTGTALRRRRPVLA